MAMQGNTATAAHLERGWEESPSAASSQEGLGGRQAGNVRLPRHQAGGGATLEHRCGLPPAVPCSLLPLPVLLSAAGSCLQRCWRFSRSLLGALLHCWVHCWMHCCTARITAGLLNAPLGVLCWHWQQSWGPVSPEVGCYPCAALISTSCTD